MSVSKDVTIMDQAMKVVADLPLNKKAARVAVTTNVDKIGDVTLNLVQRGNTNHLRDGQGELERLLGRFRVAVEGSHR